MKKIIGDVFEKQGLQYGFVSLKTYMEKRNELQLNDTFSDYSAFKGYKSVVMFMVPYPSKTTKYKGKGYGILSRYSYHLDYHIVLRRIIKNIEIELQEQDISAKGYVDVSPIDERFASYLAGLGFFGKNSFIINKDYGTYYYIGGVLIDVDIEDDNVVTEDCGDCRICIDLCPAGALEDNLDQSLCISAISQEKKAFDEHELSLFKTMIYGCDICQKVCPKNKGIDIHKYSEFEPSGIENINLTNLLEMSNKEYYNIYKDNASSWRGPLVIKRNALALLLNHNNKESIPLIKKSLVKYSDVLWYNKTAELVIKLLERK